MPRPWGAEFNRFGDVAEVEEETGMVGGVIDWDNLNNNREENERKRWAHLPALTKDFYSELEGVRNRDEEQVAKFRLAMNNIEVENFNKTALMHPVETFEEASPCSSAASTSPPPTPSPRPSSGCRTTPTSSSSS